MGERGMLQGEAALGVGEKRKGRGGRVGDTADETEEGLVTSHPPRLLTASSSTNLRHLQGSSCPSGLCLAPDTSSGAVMSADTSSLHTLAAIMPPSVLRNLTEHVTVHTVTSSSLAQPPSRLKKALFYLFYVVSFYYSFQQLRSKFDVAKGFQFAEELLPSLTKQAITDGLDQGWLMWTSLPAYVNTAGCPGVMKTAYHEYIRLRGNAYSMLNHPGVEKAKAKVLSTYRQIAASEKGKYAAFVASEFASEYSWKNIGMDGKAVEPNYSDQEEKALNSLLVSAGATAISAFSLSWLHSWNPSFILTFFLHFITLLCAQHKKLNFFAVLGALSLVLF
eukprot:GHVQ01018204.1.p1 GENE.GHVQ01018204.1~~GHVQ01018204.1.p1  ORF type:complete len:335 (-),score=46.43 GHVQ01018204.1:392-1396(-)